MEAPKYIYVTTTGLNPLHHPWGCWTTRECDGIKYIRADLAELTWEHIWKIWNIIDEVRNDFCDNPKMFKLKDVSVDSIKQSFCEEILHRFNEIREK